MDATGRRAVVAFALEQRFGLSAAEAALLVLACHTAPWRGAEGVQKRALQIALPRTDLDVRRVGTLSFLRKVLEAFPELAAREDNR